MAKKIIKDIKVLGPKDKLLILAEKHTPESQLALMTDRVAKFMKNNERFLFIRGLQIFILKDGAEVSLAQSLNEEEKNGIRKSQAE